MIPLQIVKRPGPPFSDATELSSLGISVGSLYHSILLKCNYLGPLSDLLLALGVANLSSLTVESAFGDDSLAGFGRLPFNLEELHFQDVSSLPSRGIPSRGFSGLRLVDISYTDISVVPNLFFSNVGASLQTLKIFHNNELSSFPAEALSGLSSLRTLRILHNSQMPALNSSHFQQLPALASLTFNDDRFADSLPQDLLGSNPAMTRLEVIGDECAFRMCHRDFGAAFFLGMPALETFVYKPGADVNASFAADSFVYNPNLESVHLEASALLPDHDLSLVGGLNKLKILRVLGCELHRVLHWQLLEGKSELESVDLGKYNLFDCDNCPTVETLWALGESGRLANEEEVLLNCKRGEEVSIEEAKKKHCSGGMGAGVMVGLVVVTAILVIACGVCVNWRRRKMSAQGSSFGAGGAGGGGHLSDCTHDAFISYAAEDEDCALRVLRVLEEDNPLRCLVHTRDFEAGESIMDNIVRAVARSRLTVLVVSRAYLCSEWCNSEVAQAERLGRRVLVVMRGERDGDDEGVRVRAGDLEGHPGIARHLESRTYLDEVDEDFDRKLAAAAVRLVRSKEGEEDEEPFFPCFNLGRWNLRSWREQVELSQRGSPPDAESQNNARTTAATTAAT